MHFFDTYAIIEVTKGNESYEKFKDLIIITSVLNVGEMYQITLRKHGKDEADEWYKNSNYELLEISSDIMIEAIYFRFINKRTNISLVDAVGYILSHKHNLKLLTGDNQFRDLPNVEFVK